MTISVEIELQLQFFFKIQYLLMNLMIAFKKINRILKRILESGIERNKIRIKINSIKNKD